MNINKGMSVCSKCKHLKHDRDIIKKQVLPDGGLIVSPETPTCLDCLKQELEENRRKK